MARSQRLAPLHTRQLQDRKSDVEDPDSSTGKLDDRQGQGTVNPNFAARDADEMGDEV